MPTDSNGTYTKPSSSVATDGQTALASQLNSLGDDMAEALTARVMRNGSSPMIAPLRLIDGSKDAPALTFASSTAFGLYRTPTGVGVAGTLSGIFPIGLGPLPWSRRNAPPLWVLANGQQLSRATYPDLWLVAQDEIAAGNTLYNNGNGTTTFGIADMRGRVPAGLDAGAGRLSMASSLGAVGGAQSVALNEANNGPHLHNNWLSDPGHNHTANTNGDTGSLFAGVQGGVSYSGPVGNGGRGVSVAPSGTGMWINNAWSGSGAPFGIVQPTIATNFIIYAGA